THPHPHSLPTRGREAWPVVTDLSSETRDAVMRLPPPCGGGSRVGVFRHDPPCGCGVISGWSPAQGRDDIGGGDGAKALPPSIDQQLHLDALVEAPAAQREDAALGIAHDGGGADGFGGGGHLE